MPMPKHREPLVKTSVSITERQQIALEERARKEDRPVSHFVREALDGYFEDQPTTEDLLPHEIEEIPA